MCRAFVWETPMGSVFVYAGGCPENPERIRDLLDALYAGLEKVDSHGQTTTEQLVYRNGAFLFFEIVKGGLGGLAFLFERILKQNRFETFNVRPPADFVGGPSFFPDAENPAWVLTRAGWIRRKA